MTNKKSFIFSSLITATFIVLAAVGSLYCNWALMLLIIAFAPSVVWIVKNWKNIYLKNNKKNVIK